MEEKSAKGSAAGGKTRSRFFLGVIALTAGNLFVKLVGLILKIPLHDMLGDAGMTYYNNAYDIYAWLFTVATTGLPTAIALMISEDRAKGKIKESRKILHVTLGLFVIIGLIGTSVMLFGAPLFEKGYKIEGSAYCMVAIAPTLFFICIASALRGYFQGYQNMFPTALSEVIEAVGKLALGLLFAGYALKQGYSLPIVAAFAALGLTVGVAGGMLYLIIAKLLFHPERFDPEYAIVGPESEKVRGTKEIALRLLMISIPITLSSSVQSFSAVIDGMLLSNRLQQIGYSQEATAALIGNYKTLAPPLCNLPVALIAPVTASILPLLSASIAGGNRSRTKTVMNSALMITAIIELPCALGLSVLAEPVLKLLFGDNASSERAAPLLSILALALFFTSMISMTNAFLQAHKLERKPIKSMLVGAVVKMVLLYVLVGIPKINIYGSPISSVIGGLSISLTNLYFIKKYVGFTPDFGKMLIRPFGASVVCVAVAMFSYQGLFHLFGRHLVVIPAILIAMVVYFFVVFLFRALTREDVLLLPKGEKLCGILEKMRLLKKSA